MTNPLVTRVGFWQKLGLFVFLTALAFVLFKASALYRWDLLIYDWNLMAWSRPAADNIVIVAIDEQSLREQGRWPWSRRVHADLIRKLGAAGAKGIILDILFAEPDANDPQADTELAAALTENGRVILPVLSEENRVGGQLMETLPIPVLAKAAVRIGHVNVELDADSIARGVSLKGGLGSPYWSTLALALLEASNPMAFQTLPGQRAATTPIKSPYLWRSDYRALIPFAGPPGSFRHFSYSAVLRDEVNPASFRDKYVLIGATASGMNDALPTPVSGLTQPMSGVEFNANVVDALQRGLTIQPLSWGWSLALTELGVLLTLSLYVTFSTRWTLLLAALSMLLTLLVSLVLLHGAQYWFPPAVLLLVQGLSLPLWHWKRLRDLIRSVFEKEQFAAATLHSVGDAIIVTNRQGAIQYLNPVAETMLAQAPAKLQGRLRRTPLQLANTQSSEWLFDLVNLCFEKGHSIGLPAPNLLVNHLGREYIVHASAAPLHDQRGGITAVVVALGDITAASRLSEQMAHQATHDMLTDLPNLSLLRDRLEHAIARARHNEGCLALLHVDLDDFKKVNESLGRAAGDLLLRQVKERLLACGNKEDTLARTSGDEFIYLAEDIHQIERGSDLARKILQALESPFQIQAHECFITASIGVCLFPRDGEDTETLLKNADTAMCRAKEKGYDNFQMYSHDMHVRTLERLLLEQDLRHAVEREELEVYYQPQMDLKEHRIIGAEALLRWRHPQRGWMSPLDFIPLAEESGLIDTIGQWVLETACLQVKAWQHQGLSPLRIAVNMSPRQFLRTDIADIVADILQKTGLEPRYLELEITESLLMKDVENSIATMHILKAFGVQLSIDDFGTGYSSLSYLKRFPIDQLKIDKSFLHGIETNQNDLAITLAIIAMAHSMGLNVIAEGVENEVQMAFLRVHHCDEVQGYYLSPPVSAQELLILLQKNTAPLVTAPASLSV